MIYKLTGLLRSSPIEGRTLSNWLRDDVIKGIAVHLISNGVTFAEDNNVPSKKPELGYIRSISSTVCDGYTQVVIDFEWDGCRYPIVSKVSHADIVGAGYEKKRRWIPVDEAKPELIPNTAGTAYSDAVNCLTSGRKVITAIWDGTDFIGDAEFWEAEDETITHWCPVLLPLPKEGE